MNARGLEKFCYQLNIDRNLILKAERVDVFRLKCEVPAENWSAVTLTSVRELYDSLAGEVSCQVGPPAAPMLEIFAREPLDEAELQHSLTQIMALPAESVIALQIVIEKEDLLSHIDLDKSRFTTRLYLFCENLVSLLNEPLVTLEETIFKGNAETVIIVLDSDTYVAGPILTICSLERAGDISRQRKHLPPNIQDKIARFRRLTDRLQWTGSGLQELTPLHVVVTQVDGSSPCSLSGQLYNLLLQSLIVYSANRTVWSQSEVVSTYASSDEQALVQLNKVAVNEDQHAKLLQLLVWVQSADDHEERLMFFQSLMARELDGLLASDSYSVFLERLPSVLANTKRNYRVHLDHKITRYFEKIETVINYVRDAVDIASNSINDVTKTFVDSFVTAIGFVLLTLVAALLEDKSKGLIFTAAVIAYAAYLLIFQMTYHMWIIWESVSKTHQASLRILGSYERVLGKTAIEDLNMPFTERLGLFRWVFWLTQGLYLLVIAALLALAVVLPQSLFPPVPPQQAPTITTPVSTPAGSISPTPP